MKNIARFKAGNCRHVSHELTLTAGCSCVSPPVRACLTGAHVLNACSRFVSLCTPLFYPATSFFRRGTAGISCVGVLLCTIAPVIRLFTFQLLPPNITRGLSLRFTLKHDTKSKSSKASPPLSQRRQCLCVVVCRSVRWAGSAARLKLLNNGKAALTDNSLHC